MATNFSPCKGSYVLNQFPSNVMFGMNGFHVSASGAIQGHHGPLVVEKIVQSSKKKLCLEKKNNIILVFRFLEFEFKSNCFSLKVFQIEIVYVYQIVRHQYLIP